MKSTFINHISAELRKLKSTPVIYLVGFCCAFVISIVVIAHLLDVNSIALNRNPWKRCFGAGLGIYSFFVIVPFVILLITAVSYVEQRANAWKFLYTMPVHRGSIYISKLLMLIGITFLASLLLILGLLIAGYFLDQMLPELEFIYYQPDLASILKNVLHLMIAVLGVIGFQYFLSFWFKNFLIPMSLGIVGYILAFILSTINTKIALYLPFTYPMIVKDHGMFKSDHVEEIWGGSLMNVEWYSILAFLIFVSLGYIYERWRDVE